MAANGSHQVEHRRMRFSNGAETIKLDISYPLAINDVKAALYDSDSQLLYLLIKKWYKGDSANHCLVFYIRNVFGAAGMIMLCLLDLHIFYRQPCDRKTH